MELLDAGNTGAYGHPVPTPVPLGVKKGKAILVSGHDLKDLEEILKRGSTIGMDRFGIDIILPTKQRVDTIVELCKRGWAEQMVLSHDASCHIDWFPRELIAQSVPHWNFRHISDDVIPALLSCGVSQDQIDQMTLHNPARIFSRQGPY